MGIEASLKVRTREGLPLGSGLGFKGLGVAGQVIADSVLEGRFFSLSCAGLLFTHCYLEQLNIFGLIPLVVCVPKVASSLSLLGEIERPLR